MESQKPNILVVDDTLPDLRFLSETLTKEGYKVRAVSNGARALKAAKLEPPDLILLDIKMPKMDGYEICQKLKAGQQTLSIPVIFISALGELVDKVKAFEIGGVDYITKPFQAEEVLARVNTHLKIHHQQQQIDSQNQQLQAQAIQLQDYAQELELRNAELDTFAHTVAHDLKHPLAGITSMTVRLQEILAAPATDEVLTIFKLLAETEQNAINTIDALLVLAGVSKNAVVEKAPLDMADIVAKAEQRLAYFIKDYQANIDKPATWPIAQGYAPWIVEVWANYITNGLKYGGQPPRLELGAEAQSSDMIRFWVRDNGKGLTPAEQEQLFAQFTRFHTNIDGHGLGLSIVQQIVEKLGGQVGVESTLSQGSLFYFTLPV